jgi:alpha-D-xyloside xylohydrolase
VGADPWQLRVLDPEGSVIWQEASDQPLSFQAADGARWRATHLLSAVPLDGGAVRFLAATDDPSGRVLAVDAHSLSPRVFRLTVVPSESAVVRSVGGAILATTDEQFVGLGERFTSVNQRGHLVDVWAEDRVLAGYGDSTYAPVPVLFSSGGYGFMLERFERSRFDLVASEHDRWSWEQDTASASFLIMYGPSVKELVQRLAEVTGTPPLPPIWAFGVWKTTTGGQDHVLHEAQRLRELDVPVSAVFAYDTVDYAANVGWPHVNYAGRWAGSYPDHAAFTTALHHLGLKALTYFKADFHLDRLGYDEPARLGFLARQADGHPYVHHRFPVSWLDFTNSRAVEWWGRLWRRALVDLNYDGGMLDVGEILPADAYMANGRRGLESHNQYPLLYARTAWQQAMSARPHGDFVLFARSGAVGAQQFQSSQWPGDALIRWEAPGGLRSLIPAALSFGLSGFPYWHPEVAGYLQAGLSRDDERELWLRWLQLATWTSTLRDHYGDHPTDPVDFWLDDGTIAAYREAAQIHNSLVPYLYTYAAEANRTGLPLMRFLALEAPDMPRAWHEQQSYFLGSQLLVAPVVEPGATSRTVYLPPGQWVDYWTNELYSGGQEVTVPAPLNGGRAPAFVRAGTVLPLAAAFDSLSESELPGVRTWTGDLVVRIIPGGDGPAEFTLYDGTRLAWDGATTLRVSANARPRSVELRSPDGTVVVERIRAADGEIRTE